MPDILGLHGFNRQDGLSILLAAYGGDIITIKNNVTSALEGIGFGLALDSDAKVEMATFHNHVFATNYEDRPLNFDATNQKWKRDIVDCLPRAKFVMPYRNRLYFAYCKPPFWTTTDITYFWKNIVFYTDYADLSYKYVSGANASVFQMKPGVSFSLDMDRGHSLKADNNKFMDRFGYFISRGIKVGDPLYVVNGENSGTYTVASVDSETTITTVEKFPENSGNQAWWVGGNWFYAGNISDNDEVTGMGVNNDRLLIFRRWNMYRYDESNLIEIKGAPGTTSGRSVQNIKEYTIYFFGDNANTNKTGFYLYDGIKSTLISGAVRPFMKAISVSNYDNVVAWQEGDVYRAYIGDLSSTGNRNNAYNISRNDAVFSYNVQTGRTSIDKFSDVVKCSTSFEYTANGQVGNNKQTYFGNDSSQIFLAQSGYDHDNNDIEFIMQTYPRYPRGSQISNVFTRVQIIAREARGTQVFYKLWNQPSGVDDAYHPLGEIREDFTEFDIPTHHNTAKAIQLKFVDNSTKENVLVIEKIDVFSYADHVGVARIEQQK